MIWSSPDKGINYRVCVYIVDDTYWDDGNRTTQRRHDFAGLAEAHEFLTESRKKGWYETTSCTTDEKLRRHLDPDCFVLYRYDEDWHRVNDDELLDLLALL